MNMEREAQLLAYVDGELDAAAAAEVETLLASDPQARRMVEAYRDTAALLRAACAESFYPPALPTPPVAPVRSRPWAANRAGWLVAASVLAAAFGFGGGVWWADRQGSDRAGLLDEVARYQAVYSRETVHLVEVPAAQMDHLKAWLGNRLDRKLVVPDLSADGLRFAGGRMLVSGEKPMAQLMYTRDGGAPVALCIARLTGTAAGVRVEQRGALNLAIWEDGRYAYVVVGDLDDVAAQAIAKRAELQIQG